MFKLLTEKNNFISFHSLFSSNDEAEETDTNTNNDVFTKRFCVACIKSSEGLWDLYFLYQFSIFHGKMEWAEVLRLPLRGRI